jgi:hypothetical protein
MIPIIPELVNFIEVSKMGCEKRKIDSAEQARDRKEKQWFSVEQKIHERKRTK